MDSVDLAVGVHEDDGVVNIAVKRTKPVNQESKKEDAFLDYALAV